jgi:hypothetical protein
MSYEPSNRFLNIQKSIKTPTPKVGIHLGVCELISSHSPTLPGWIFGPHLSMPLPWSWAQG